MEDSETVFDSEIDRDYKSKGLKSLSDTRKPKLTLKHLNKLKKIQSVRKLDSARRNSLLSVMYGQPEEDSGGL